MFNLRPRLNEDVLNQIYEHCPNSTLTVLCRVSSDTRELARRHMCRTVSLERNPGQLCAFLKYIVDNTHCAETGKIWGAGSHVLQLNLHWKSVSADWHNSVAGHSDFAVEDPRYPMSRWAPTLAHALTLMPRLRVFFLEAMAEKIAYHSPQFGVALGNHPSLSSIDLWFVGPLLSDQLARAAESRSFGKLQEVKLYIINGRRESEAVGRFLLRNRDHLTKISTSSWDFGVLNRIANSNSKRIAPPIFPNVVDLTVVNLHRFSFIEDIATFFPAMRTLAINWTKGDNLIVAPPSNNICFPNLVSIEGEWETISILLDCNINNAHIRRLIMSLYAEWESGTQIDDSDPKTFRGAAATSSLKSLRFMQYQIRSASWWTTFGRTIPCLTILEMGLGMKVTDMHLLVRLVLRQFKLKVILNLNLIFPSV